MESTIAPRDKPESPEYRDILDTGNTGRSAASQAKTPGPRRYELRSVGPSSQVSTLESAPLPGSPPNRAGIIKQPAPLEPIQVRTQEEVEEEERRHGALLEASKNHDELFRLNEPDRKPERYNVATNTTGLGECLLSSPTGKEDPTPVLGYRKPTQWRPLGTNEATQSVETMLNNTLQTLANLLKPQQVHYRSKAPQFEGAEWEDPEEFLLKIENYCIQQNYHQEEWILVAADQLRGDACRWFQEYKPLHLSFEEFRQRLLGKYDSMVERSRLLAKLYGEEQEREDAAMFITRKLALFKRLVAGLPEAVMAQQIREMLIPEIRMVLRSAVIHTVSQLIELATSAERDMRQINQRRTVSPGVTTPFGQGRSLDTRMIRRIDPPVAAARNGPPFPCRFCQGDHYNRDCPRRRAIEPAPGPEVRNTGPTATPPAPENSRRAAPPQTSTLRPDQ